MQQDKKQNNLGDLSPEEELQLLRKENRKLARHVKTLQSIIDLGS